jgi:hypothetical protein
MLKTEMMLISRKTVVYFFMIIYLSSKVFKNAYFILNEKKTNPSLSILTNDQNLMF